MQKLLEGVPYNNEVVYRGSVYTVARATAKIKAREIVSEGISRRACIDEPDPVMGDGIALGRARKGLHLKIKEYKSLRNRRFMG